MTREQFLEMALKVAVDVIEKTSRKHNAFPPVLEPLKATVEKMQSERDIALIKYCFEHPNS